MSADQSGRSLSSNEGTSMSRDSHWIYAAMPLAGAAFAASWIAGWDGFLLWLLGVISAFAAARARELLR